MICVRVTTGCFACKTKHKKCDETRPQCLRCQKSRKECPGYTYIHHPDKPNRRFWALPAPRTVSGQSRAVTLRGQLLANAQEPGVRLPDQLPPVHDLVTSQPAYNALDTSVVAGLEMLPETTDISSQCASSSLSSGPLQYSATSSNTPDPLVVGIPNHCPTLPPTSGGTTMPMASGQVNLLAAIFSPTPGPAPQPQGDQPVTESSVSGVKQRDDVASHGHVYQEGITSIIYRQPVLDRTAESNALPFVLQSYALWISKLAFEPRKVSHANRDFVFSHFEDGQLQSRWIISLLANVAGNIGNAEFMGGKRRTMLSALESAMRQRLGAVKRQSHITRSELIKVLDSAIETIHMHCYIGHSNDTIALKHEILPIVRQLCAESPGAPIHLLSLLRHPVGSVRRFAELDIVFNVIQETPTLLQYELDVPASPPCGLGISAVAMQGDGIVQWLHGLPNQLILVFAKMLSMRANRSTPNEEAIVALEREIYDLRPYNEASSDRYIAIMRSFVQECWRQVAFVYLYMAVCGDPSGTPRVKEAFRRFMRLLDGTQPGHLPDEFLAAPLIIISPAAQSKRDRKVIRQHMLGLHRLNPPFHPDTNVVCSVEGRWARADAEGRQGLCPDVSRTCRQGSIV